MFLTRDGQVLLSLYLVGNLLSWYPTLLWPYILLSLIREDCYCSCVPTVNQLTVHFTGRCRFRKQAFFSMLVLVVWPVKATFLPFNFNGYIQRSLSTKLAWVPAWIPRSALRSSGNILLEPPGHSDPHSIFFFQSA